MITIIIPALNEENSIGATLEYLMECILNSPFSKGGSGGIEAEIILADGGSKDKTREIASEHGVKVLIGTDSSRAFLMNLGAKEAKGDVLFFLHADSYPPKSFIQDIERAFFEKEVRHGQTSLSMPPLILKFFGTPFFQKRCVVGGAFDHKFSEDVFLLKVVSFFNRIRFRLTRNYYGDQGIFVRKETFERLDGYKNMSILEDMDFSERLRKAGRVVLINKRLLTSGRRFIKNGILRTSMFMMWVRILYRLGFDTERLAKIYRAFSTPPHLQGERIKGRGGEQSIKDS